MKRPPLFIAPEAIAPPRVVLADQDARRALHALRLRPGDRVRVSDGAETIYLAEITRTERDRAEAAILQADAIPSATPPHVEILQILPKPQLAERLLGPCTTLGVAAFHFVPGGRTPIPFDGVQWRNRLQRWRSIVRSAAAQSEVAREAALHVHPSLSACYDATLADRRFVADESVAGPMGEGLLGALTRSPRPRTIQWLIGPEGGLADADRARFEEWGIAPVSLGRHILRLETAAVVAVALTLAVYDSARS